MTHPTHHHPSTHTIFRGLLIVLPTILSILTWLLVGALFLENNSGGEALAYVGFAVVTFALTLALFAVNVVVNTHRNDRALLIGLLAASCFFGGASLFTVLAAGLITLGLLVWQRGMQREEVARVRFSFQRTIQSSLNYMLTFLLLAVTAQSVSALQPHAGPGPVIDSLVRGGVRIVEVVGPRLLPGFTSDRSLNQYLFEQVRKQPIPADQVDRAIADAQVQLEQNLGIGLRGDETLSQLTEMVIRQHAAPTLDRFSGALIPIIVVSLFLLLKLFSPFLWLLITIFANGIFRLFWQLRVVRTVTENVPAERLVTW